MEIKPQKHENWPNLQMDFFLNPTFLKIFSYMYIRSYVNLVLTIFAYKGDFNTFGSLFLGNVLYLKTQGYWLAKMSPEYR